MASSGRGLTAGLAATDFCGCGAGFTAAGFTGTGLAAGLTEAAALGAALGATGFAAVALGIVLGAAAWAAVFAAGALLTVVLAGVLAGVLAAVLAEFLVIMLLFLADVFLADVFLDCPTEALLPVAFLGGEPDFWALAASEWAFVAFTERAVAVRDVLAGPSVTFLALVFEFLALLLRVLADTGCTRNCHASVR